MFRIRSTIEIFFFDRSGGVAAIFGLSFVALMCCVGIALDTSRIHNIQSRVQTALDAAALSGAKILDPDSYDEAMIRETAERMFYAQAKMEAMEGAVLSNFAAAPQLSDRTVEASVDVNVPSIFGRLTGRGDRIEFRASSKTRYMNRKVEVALVVDITGSMCDTPPALSDPPCVSGAKIDALKAAAKEMVDAFYGNAPAPGAVRMSLVPYAASVNVGPSYFGNVAVTGGAVDTCVLEREGIDQYTNVVPQIGSLFETTGNTVVPFYYSCPAEEITPLTDLASASARQSFKDKIDALSAKWGTAGHIGLAWGWYTLSPEWTAVWPSESDPKPYREDVVKVIVLMTDGMFNSSYWTNGIALVGADKTNATVVDSSPYQALQLCQSILDRTAEPNGPIVYTVSFMAPPEADALMEQCAGTGNSYTADNRSELVGAFADIVTRLTRLAVTN